MATLRLFGPASPSGQLVVMNDDIFFFNTFVSSSDTFYRFISTSGDLITVTGTDFVINGAGRFGSGTVTSLAVNDGPTSSDTLLFTMPDLNVDGRDLFGVFGAFVPSTDDVWNTLMDGETEIVSFRGLGLGGGADGNGISGSTYVQGEDSVVRGDFLGSSYVSGGLYRVSGDAIYDGGDMNFRGFASVLAGDVYWTRNDGTVKGGDDRLVITDFSSSDIAGTTAWLAGDVAFAYDNAVVFGGDDYIDARNVASFSGTFRIAGDVADTSGTNHTVIGGDDLIAGSRTLDNLISGDLLQFSAGNRVIGGDDTIYSFDGNDSLYGDVNDINANTAGGNDTIYGGGGADLIVGNGGRDTFFKAGGSATIYGGNGHDYFRPTEDGAYNFYGGQGRDTVSYANATDFRITVDLEDSNQNGGSASDDLLVSVENYFGSNASQDFVYGTSGANIIATGGANDLIFGRGGGDTIRTGNGNDRIEAGSGANTYFAGAGFDLLSYEDSPDGIYVDLQNNIAEGGFAEGDTIAGVEHIYGSLTDDDIIVGDSAGNILAGRGGQDRIYGRDGVDVLNGNQDNDRLFGGAGFDRVLGGGGADYIEGGLDDDYLFGGTGADVFHFNRGDSVDRIRDFEDNIDTIQIDGYNLSFNPLSTATQQNGHVYIRLGGGDWIIVENTTIGALINDFEVV